jgi:folylpolyglutamate synthase/dihydropteroate synthase
VFGVMADKETEAMQKLIEPYAKKIIFTEVEIPRALSKDILYDRSTHPYKSKCAIHEVINVTSGTTLVIGSLYLVSAIRNQII